MIKTLDIYGLIFAMLDYGFIWINFYLDLAAESTIKKPVSSSVTAEIFIEHSAMHPTAQLEIYVCLFSNQFHYMVNWLANLHHNFF